MQLDKVVHSKPEFYMRKLDFIATSKRLLYKLLWIDSLVTRQREEIARRNEAILDKYVSGRKVLEVGCGRGGGLVALMRRKGCSCCGVDVSPEMIDFAKEHNPGPSYRVADSAKLPFDENQFDFVIFNYVLHHVDDLENTIREAKRVGRHVIIYEAACFEHQPLKSLSRLFWKLTDGGHGYKSLSEWKSLFNEPAIEEIRGTGLVRYGMCIFKKSNRRESFANEGK